MSYYKFVGTTELTYTLPFTVTSLQDLSIYEEDTTNSLILMDSSKYTFDISNQELTFTDSINGKTIVAIRKQAPVLATPYQEGEKRSSESINDENNNNYNIQNDIIDSLKNCVTYPLSVDPNAVDTNGFFKDSLVKLPIPPFETTALVNPYALCFDGTKYQFKTLQPSGSAGELKLELSSNNGASLIGYNESTVQSELTGLKNLAINLTKEATSTTASGAYEISYFNGTGSVTLQTEIDAFKATATATISGANRISAWNKSGPGNSTTVQALFNSLFETASATLGGSRNVQYWNGTTSESVQSKLDTLTTANNDLYVTATASNTGKAMDMYVWDSSDGGHSLSVGQAVIELYGIPSASNTDLGAGRVNYYNARKTATETVKSALDASLQYAIGQYIPGVVPATTLPNGDWISIKSGESLGSATSGATHSGPGYESLYIFIRVNYIGDTSQVAQAAWSANTPITPSSLSTNPIAGVNTWRYA